MNTALPGKLPIVQAPLAGGPSTPELAAAVAAAGGFPYVAAGYLSPEALRRELARTRELTPAPVGVNVFVPSSQDADDDTIATYAASLEPDAAALGVDLGEPRWDDDGYDAKLALLAASGLHTVSFTFGCPAPDVVRRLHAAGSRVAVTVTSAAEARVAAAAAADSLIVQGAEAGGHQGTFEDRTPNRTPLLEALDAVRAAVDLPLIAAGGIMTSGDAARALDAGASAVQLGTALLCTPEANTSQVHRAALLGGRFTDTVVTRAFTGRWARGLANSFALAHLDAPRGYPQIHKLTRPLRVAAIARANEDIPNLWAGTGWRSIAAAPAGDIVRRIAQGL